MPGLEAISKGIHRLSRLAADAACIVGALLVLLVLAEIVRRAVFGSSFLWAFEISSWLMVAFVFLGMAYTLQTGGHVRVELLTARLGRRALAGLELAQAVCGAGLFAFLTFYLVKGMLSNYETGARGLSELDPPLYLIWAVAAGGIGVFALQFAALAIDRWLALQTGEEAGHE
jgi:TRAP-type C4-dicarboxylate transport system permease small subunit